MTPTDVTGVDCPTYPETAPSVRLAMIVRNEADAILALAGLHFDSWCIVDTGSTDGTQAAVLNVLARPGALYERPWVNFAHNRNELLDLARGRADYLLLWDAGWTLEGEQPHIQPPYVDRYDARFVRGGVEWWRPLLVRADLPWRYVGATHEYLACDRYEGVECPHTSERIDGVTVHPGEPNTERFPRDRGLLLTALDANPRDPRATFYLAQTCRDMGSDREAAHWYLRRTQLDGYAEERYVAWVERGRALVRLGEWAEAADAFVQGWEERPQRMEAVRSLCALYHSLRLHAAAAAIEYACHGTPMPDDGLFLEPEAYRW